MCCCDFVYLFKTAIWLGLYEYAPKDFFSNQKYNQQHSLLKGITTKCSVLLKLLNEIVTRLVFDCLSFEFWVMQLLERFAYLCRMLCVICTIIFFLQIDNDAFSLWSLWWLCLCSNCIQCTCIWVSGIICVCVHSVITYWYSTVYVFGCAGDLDFFYNVSASLCTALYLAVVGFYWGSRKGSTCQLSVN